MSCAHQTPTAASIFMPQEAVIISSERETELERKLTLRMANGEPFLFEPGQIVELGLFGYGEIPLGIASSPTNTDSFQVVIRAVGRVSNALLRLDAGDKVTLRGPLGHGFPLEELRGHNILIVAGGIGLCPTRSLILYILDRPGEFGTFSLFFGVRSPKEMLFKHDLEIWRDSRLVNYYETVDDPTPDWTGHTGVITTLFDKAEGIGPNTRVIICGPPVMYKFVMRKLTEIGIQSTHVFVDLERRMKCGVGKCGHCQINDKYVCLDGPVFRFCDIEHLEEAI
jgi:sulfhydrogenase subunit gamma (sulfur reductase)